MTIRLTTSLSPARLEALMNKANASVERLKVGDLFLGAFGSAEQDGITDEHERSVYSAVWLSCWNCRKGKADFVKDQPSYVISIED